MRSTRALRSAALYTATAVLFAASIADAANLLTNPGFESPPGTGSVDVTVTGWTVLGDAARANFANNTAGGSRSIWFKTFVPDGGGVRQDVGITGGANYTFSGFNFFESSYPTTSSIVTMSVTWLDAGGTSVGTPTSVVYDPATPPAVGTWVPFNVNTTAPAGAVTARVFGGWDGGGAVTGAQSVFFDDVVLDGPGTPPVNAWAQTGSGDWNVGINWLNGSVPNGVGAAANFLGSIDAPRTVYSDTAVTVGSITFNNANQYVITGAGSLTMDVASGTGAINVQNGSHKINLPLRLNDSTVATVAGGATLTIADPLILANGSTLTKAGAGTMEIISTVTTLGGPATISTSGGTSNLRTSVGVGTSLRSTGGETRTFATQRVSSVQIDGGTVAIDSAGATKVIVTDSLTFAGGASPAGKLDVGDNGVVVRYSGTSPAAAIRELIKSGRAGGNGIVTSNATANRGIGYADASQIGSPTTFLGEAFSGAAVLLRYTLFGDANLSGSVNFADLVSLAQNYNQSNREWVQGDFNYDNSVNFADLVLLAQNYNQSLPSALEAAALGGDAFAADFARVQAFVPEPASLAMVALAGGLVGRRRVR